MYKKIIYLAIMVLLLIGVVIPNNAYAIKGVDISTLLRQEADGVKYHECGVQKDPLIIFKNHGINLVRIQLFVDPNTKDTGTAMNLAYVKTLAVRCKAAGMKIMLDIHYSDTWANPGIQTKPAAWKDLTQKQLVTKIFEYTKDVCTQIKPSYVQIGNEINCGILWPNGNACPPEGNWANLRELITSAHKGAKAANGKIVTIAHVAEKKAADAKWYFDNLLASKVSFDMIGLSYYKEYHGDLANFKAIYAQAKSYGKKIIICELGEYYTGNPTTYTDNPATDMGKSATATMGKPATEDTQAKFITDVMAINSDVVYWEPAWVYNSPVGDRALFKPISGDQKNVEMTKGLASFGCTTCP